MRLGWFINLIVIGVALSGGQALWTGITNMHPQHLTCAQYMKQADTDAWLELSDCRVDYLESVKVYRTIAGSATGERDYYAPVRASGNASAPVSLIVKASPSMKGILDKLYALSDKGDRQGLRKLIKDNKSALVQDHLQVSGLIIRGMDSSRSTRDVLEKDPPKTWQLKDGWKIIDVAASPSISTGLVMTALAVLILLWQIRVYTRRKVAVPDGEVAA